MGYKLTSEERRIIERARKEGEELYAGQTAAEKRAQMLRSVVIWVGGLVLLAAIGMLIAYIGSRF